MPLERKKIRIGPLGPSRGSHLIGGQGTDSLPSDKALLFVCYLSLCKAKGVVAFLFPGVDGREVLSYVAESISKSLSRPKV